jgi:8-oxo-dGTP pyrophosphatase MutT (NUDIX family)
MDTTSGRPAPLPDDGLPVIERSTVRLVVLDTQHKMLLFHTRDLGNPDLGTWWELPAGGIDPGETYRDAAVRELREETGIIAARSLVGAEPGHRHPPVERSRADRPAPRRCSGVAGCRAG